MRWARGKGVRRGRAGAEPRGSRELLAGQAGSSQEPTCHPGEGRCRQHSPLEAHRPRRACLSPRCEVCEGWQTEQKPLQDLSHFSIFYFIFFQNLQDERQQPSPGDPAAEEHASDLRATELQGKIQQLEATNQVFLCVQQAH